MRFFNELCIMWSFVEMQISLNQHKHGFEKKVSDSFAGNFLFGLMKINSPGVCLLYIYLVIFFNRTTSGLHVSQIL